MMSIVVGITFILCFLMSKPLMAYQLGESYAVNLGVNIKRIRVLLVLLSSLLSACIVAFAGPISFVRNSRATHSKKHAKEHKAHIYDTGLLPWWSGVLPVL